MRFALMLLACAPAFAEAPAGPKWVPELLTQEEAAEGFYPLFNGANLDGWWIRGENKRAFRASEGRLEITGEGGGDWLFTDREYENFVIRYEYRCIDGIGNSGVGIHAPKEGNPAFTGFEIQVIQPGWETPWQRSGALYSTVAPAAQADNPMGEWNSVEVLVDGPRVRTTLNGQELYEVNINDYAPEKLTEEWQKPLTDRAKSGYIAIQDYGNRVDFRNIRIKPLPGGEGWRPLFNGKDLEGWQAVGDAKWEVADGVLRVSGEGMTQRSGLRTLEEFGDFELRLSARTSGNANSGVFFRCRGNDPWPRSYEAQIHNHDPKQFTGAIWDQVPARELRAMDNAWFHMSIVARGANIQVAVNGKTVVDYISRRHKKFPSGWLLLQAHDTHSVVEFKDIEIKPILHK